MKHNRGGFGRVLLGSGLVAGLIVGALLLWGIVFPTQLLDLVQALDFALG